MIIEYNPKIQIIVGLIDLLYKLPNCGAGGCCHIVVDDYNIQDDHLNYVINYCNAPEQADCIDREISKLICEILLQLNEEQRYATVALKRYFEGDCDKNLWDYYTEQLDLKEVRDFLEQ